MSHRSSHRHSHLGSSRNRTTSRGHNESSPSHSFDFERYKSKLIKIFFRPDDLITHGSSEYRDFWAFLHKYQAFQKKTASHTKKPSPDPPGSANLGLSPVFDRSLLQCLQLEPSDPRDLLNRISLQDEDRPLTQAMILEFRHILTLYIDFLQKEKIEKIRKLRQSQANLPIAEYRDVILDKLKTHQVIIVAGDTGCGKSTQVPQYLLNAGYNNIACTQPRRIACISLAKRVGFETLNEYGTQIGYQIRFERKKTDKTKVLFLTEGLLLRQVSSDPSLSGYDVIVLDEVHERHLHGDFLLGIVKCLVHQRSDIKVILMSATINIKLFQEYFHNEAPVIQVPGRLFPIKLEYHPVPSIEKSSSEKLNPAPYVRILQLIDKKYPDTERGDLLIFLSGIKEITTVVDASKEYAEKTNRWIVLALHSTLSLADQDKVFDYPPEGVRKCIVSTNIAETSITIDGVRFVVDSGKVKEMQYDPVCKMQRLKEFWISRASAEQRKGRSGRTGPGVCFRLFSDAEYKALAPYSTPEIQRVPLDNLILQMIAMGLPDARKFPFIEPPPVESVENSILMLKEQGALNEDESLTVSGRMLSNLPVDVTIGKMLIMGTMFHQVESVLSLAAALSVQSPFTNSAYRDADCVAARRNLDSDHGDPITLLNSYRDWLRIKSNPSESSRKWCKKRGLEEQRFYEMTKLRAQFKELLEQSGLMEKGHEDMSKLSSSERAVRHGELKQLRNLKRDILKKEGPRKKKILKMTNLEGVMESEDMDDNTDLKDIEFRMKNDGKKVRDLLEGSKAISYKDLSILKLIVAGGLYPQFAIADEFNHAKSGADQLFHTRVKPFNVLHPNSIFAASPEYLALDSMDIVNMPGFPGKYPVSLKHQILVYLSLLETNKPYLVNTLRMPLLQAMLLFAHTIDTNSVFSRFVFDSWVETRFPDIEQAQNILLSASKIRRQWDRLLHLRLLDTMDKIDDPVASGEEQTILEAMLSKNLLDFMHTEILFSVKRLLPGDIKVLYLGPSKADLDVTENPFDNKEFQVHPHEKKGGMILTKYLVYGCLENSGEETHSLAMDWTCGFCEKEMYVGPLERVSHYGQCREEAERIENENKYSSSSAALASSSKPVSQNARFYYCETCEKDFQFSAVEILKHKKSHRRVDS
ncbi:hypothetical protein TCAL_10894 [Tigriopus californicus]|uniref:RNA helicase n=1 Tax=Tigriopus californicus TaxID=6832 RepID=A0A553NER4_TIGCA|nr:probable ATP-dependent RNA helicase DHX34 [Tigriopus californicus]TRY63932.1 hypothetical protein TCAL_10894 [Tigriopus californicus]